MYRASRAVSPSSTAGVVLGVIVAALAMPADARGADRIILRNLDVIGDRTVVALDEDGVRLDNGQVITWDAIEKGQVAADRQAEFDRLLNELGTHLYRVRQRLTVGDYRGILRHAEAVYPRYVGRKSETAYMVFQALMWARLAHNQRELALEPYLRCYQYMRAQGSTEVNLPGSRRLQLNPKTAISAELPPIWFDVAAARQALEPVRRAIAELPSPRPEGTRIYFASLALTAGDEPLASRVLQGLEGQDAVIAQLRDITLAQREVMMRRPGTALTQLERALSGLSPQTRPLALYWLGVAKIQEDSAQQRQQGMLQLLHIPALFASQHPELAGAALYQTMEALVKAEDIQASIAIRRELLERFGQTYHAAKVKAQLGAKPDS